MQLEGMPERKVMWQPEQVEAVIGKAHEMRLTPSH
jgi:hypothetical protein